ncbi:HTTM domain-containing protein [Leucobacter chromiireducens]|uniref:HTTM domain-containing protein n=1 Tax=Leucobacter chromiireducens subsp. solipictus TaxID=398235 RepID=A0ABS1SDR8_9MICO|nr:HTTM domain-containing protein [Leucobacter chromiireducens]MBL3678531.1 HTTM domain-containing protein [Leucobacter chromiireducens subsp. solipictus]
MRAQDLETEKADPTTSRAGDAPTLLTPDAQPHPVSSIETRAVALPRALVFLGSVVNAVVLRAVLCAVHVWRLATDWLFSSKKAEFGIAVTRILMGLTALGLLLTNWSTRLYSFGAGSAWNGEMAEPVSAFPKIWLFSLFHRAMPNNAAYTALYIALIVLALLVIVGWRFRLVGPIFWVMWVSFIEATDMLGDQGDNMYRIAFLLLLFTDPAKRWSLDARRRTRKQWFSEGGSANQIGTLLHNLALVALTAQVIFVYGAGAMFKSGGAPWREGWAVYDPLATARFGTWPVLTDIFTAWGPMVAVASLGSVFLQAAFGFMLLHRATRIVALVGILGFHIGIGVLMGLPWFSLTMIAVDSIFIRDRSWQRVSAGLHRRWRQAGASPHRELAAVPERARESAPAGELKGVREPTREMA